MAGLYNLMILGVMLIGVVVGVEGVADQQFQELSNLVKGLQDENKEMSNLVKKLQDENEKQFRELREVITKNDQQDSLIEKIVQEKTDETIPKPKSGLTEVEQAQNTTIEERVTLLELQVVEIQGDIAVLVENDDFFFDEQVIQDERLLNLETETEGIEEEVEILQDTTQELNFRVTILEENGGSNGNSSISELEERVETLEGTATDHETRLLTAESAIEALDGTTSEHETRLTAAEENIQGLQVTDINHESRITALEENGGGGGGSQNGTIAFHTVLTDYSTISTGSAVEFNEILLNEGDGYDSTTGVFTVPPGGNGLYYFSAYLMLDLGKYATFDIRINGATICSAYSDHDAADRANTSCGGVADIVEGDEVIVEYRSGTDTTPLYVNTMYFNCGFTGFRM